MRNGRLVVRPHSVWKRFLAGASVLALSVWTGFFLYRAGHETGIQDYTSMRSERDQLAEEKANLEGENTRLRTRIATLERAGQVDERAYAEIDRALESLHDERLALQEELRFYQNLVASPKSTSGLKIQSFDVKLNGTPRAFRYRLVLTHFRKDDKVTAGAVHLYVTGERGGAKTRLSLSDLTGRQDAEIDFELRNYQRLEGEFVLPEGFVPRQVLVKVKANGARTRSIEKTISWPSKLG